MKPADLIITARHSARVPVSRLWQRLAHRKAMRAWTGRPVADLASVIDVPAARYDPAIDEVADAIARLRALTFSNAPSEVAAGRVTLRGQAREIAPLDRFDWSALSRAAEADVNWFYELSYVGFLVPNLAAPETQAQLIGALAGLEAVGAAGAWSKSLGWKPIAASNRLINLVPVLAALTRGSADAETLAAVMRHGDICEGLLTALREDHLQYNHLVFNIVAVLLWRAATGKALPNEALRTLKATLDDQILPDGGHAERSATYHAHVLSMIQFIAATPGVGDDLSAWLAKAAARMAAALPVMSHPDGDIALFNDAALFDAPPASAFVETPQELYAVLPQTGYGQIRSGRGAVILDGGAPGPRDNPGHGHSDYLSIEASWEGRRLIVDYGVSSYVAGRERDLTRGGVSHNGPRLEGRELIEFSGAFRVGRSSRAGVVQSRKQDLKGLSAWCQPWFDGGARLERDVLLFSPDVFLIVDRWIGRGQPASPTFLIPSDWTCRLDADGGLNLNEKGGATATIQSLFGDGVSLAEAVYWPLGAGRSSPAHQLMVIPRAHGAGRASVLAVGAPGAVAEAHAELVALAARLLG